MAFVALLGLTAASAEKIRYENHKVLRLQLDEPTDAQIASYRWLRDHAHEIGVDFWSNTDMQVSPAFEPLVRKYLNTTAIKYDVMIDNVQDLLDLEADRLTKQTFTVSRDGAPDPTFFNDYRKIEDINAFLDQIVSTYPSLAKKIEIGTTYENRTIYGVVLTGEGAGSSKPGIYYEGGIHSREWIAHTTVLYILYTLATQYGKDDKITKYVNAIEWTLIPAINVDGYVYTWQKDRMWRKTRSPNKASTCIGTDPNRNWDSHWCEQGASTQPCSDSYCGSHAFSEKETKASADWVRTHTNIRGFIDFHSYSQLWMRPYGYTQKLPADATAQKELGLASVAAIKATHGMVYQEGSIYEIIYPASGSSADYVYDTCHVKYAYGVELRDTGQHGFILPAAQIVPTGEEIFAAAKVMADYILTHP